MTEPNYYRTERIADEMELSQLSFSQRKGIAGRHIVACGQPAKEEKDAFVTGNGILLLSAMGCPWADTLTLRHEEYIAPQWREAPKAPDIADYLEPVRQLLLQGEYEKAADMAANAAKMRGPGTTLQSSPGHPALLLQMEQALCDEARDYMNTLNMRTSLVTTRWRTVDGDYSREYFCSRADSIAAVRFRGPRGKLYPGDEIQPELDEGLYRAAYAANRMRAFGNQSCHGVMHRAQSAARLKDAFLTQAMLRFTLESGFVNDNFTTVHNPYFKDAMPDGQGALPTVLLESLLYSRPGFLEPLPARPEGCFRKGTMRGMAARTFAAIDQLSWDFDRQEIHLIFTPLKSQTITLCYRNGYEKIIANVPLTVVDNIHASIQVERDVPIEITWLGAKEGE